MSNLFVSISFLAVAGLAVEATPAYLTLYSEKNYTGSSINFMASVPNFLAMELDFIGLSGCVRGMWFLYMGVKYQYYLSSYAGITEEQCFTLPVPVYSAQYIGRPYLDASACAIGIFSEPLYNGAAETILTYPATNYFQVSENGDYYDYSEYITTFYGYAIAGNYLCYLTIPNSTRCIYATSHESNIINKAYFSAPAIPPGIDVNNCVYPRS